MKLLVLGAGMMGRAIAADLLTAGDVSHVTMCDASSDALATAMTAMPPDRLATLTTIACDVGQNHRMYQCVQEHDGIVAALPWPATTQAIAVAVDAGRPLISITRPDYEQLPQWEARAAHAQVPLLLGCGLEPGLTELCAQHIGRYVSDTHTLHLQCGGIPLNPIPPLGYKRVFGGTRLPIGLRPAYEIHNGKLRTVPRFSGVESVELPGIGVLEAWHDGMLPWLRELPCLRKVRTCTQKTLRWPGFAQTIQTLAACGLLGEEPVAVGEGSYVPRHVVEQLVAQQTQWQESDRDLVVLRIMAEGVRNGETVCGAFSMVVRYCERRQMTAMAIATGVTAATICRMVVQGEIMGRGVIRLERSIGHKGFERLQQALGRYPVTWEMQVEPHAS